MNKPVILTGLFLFIHIFSFSQNTFPVNGIADERTGYYAFTHATIVQDAKTIISNGTLIIREGKILAIGQGLKVPRGAVEINCQGKYIYPSFIDIFSDYGMPPLPARQQNRDFFARSQLTSNTKGAYGWNQAIRPETEAYRLFALDEAKARNIRDLGFGTVLTHMKDGIARGSGVLVTLAETRENTVILKERASAHYSFNKGSSTQSYPGSLMGSIALLRQSYLDAAWYRNRPEKEGVNLSLQAWLDNQGIPQVFEAGDKWNNLRADRIGDEFGVQYIIKGGGNEYQRIAEMKATGAAFIISLNFPRAQDVEDPVNARFVSLADMKHWELAPTNPAALEKAGIIFCLTLADLRDPRQFMSNLRMAIQHGLTEETALNALTSIPAGMLNAFDRVGSLHPGKVANLLITSGPVFHEKTVIYQNWVQGIRYNVKDDLWNEMRGKYSLVLNLPSGPVDYILDFRSPTSASLIGKDTVTSRFYFDGRQVRINVAPERSQPGNISLSGFVSGTNWTGYGEDSAGNRFTWQASLSEPATAADTVRPRRRGPLGAVTYPLMAYGWPEGGQPHQQTILIRNATVWTNEKEGILRQADVLIRNGKIAAVGRNLSDPSARVIDGTGMHVTPGIIDEHSHIATASVNEGGQSVTSEVRIGDNINPDDINIYRQLSGGVTTSHILHGSANTIGGQTQLIKLRWGADDEGLKFAGWPGQIKFALGENVKRSPSAIGNNSNNNRYPDTRMGVEQVLVDAFTRAREYQKAWNDYHALRNKKGVFPPRRDLELEALVEILENKRFITCHSYVQSEITAAMRVAEMMGYRVNTLTHILEGYKVADKMRDHGAHASTFSDWWAYKMEVQDAIPYNAAIMHRVGLNVAINSDDAEMARRLNQEAAKVMKYGGLGEEEALKMVTLNPARMLHVEDRVGSLRAGKDADVVIWTDHPLSIYAKVLYTIVDGAIYFDRDRDMEMQAAINEERSRLIRKMVAEKKGGGPVQPAQPGYQVMHGCFDHVHSHGLLIIDTDE